jgi:Co/Zn/Cd efflux system component
MNKNSSTVGWPTAMVAVAVVLLVGSITVTAIVRYNNADEALKIWAALSGVVGLLTGAFVTYFFTQGTVQEAKEARAAVQEQANKADVRLEALAATTAKMNPESILELKKTNPSVQKALGV